MNRVYGNTLKKSSPYRRASERDYRKIFFVVFSVVDFGHNSGCNIECGDQSETYLTRGSFLRERF